ncbi:MAG: M48 family metallopeptidase [bacterium]
MNIYFLIILIALIGIRILETVSQWLNLKALTPVLPKEFEGVYDSGEYERSQRYTKTHTIFAMVESFFSLAVLLGFWFFGGFNRLDIWIRGAGYHPIVNGLLFFGVLMFVKFIYLLPFNIYSTFIIEEKFGFNKTTVPTFIEDNVKMVLLTTLLGGLILAGLLAFFEWTGVFSWLYGWLAVTMLIIILQFIVPVWIMPLFNKFTPLEDGGLKSAIMDYANSVKFPLQGIFKMDGSKRSAKSNAFFTGFGKNKRIVLFDTLIERHSIKELVSVLAHEIGHYKKKHIIKDMIISIMQMGMFFYLLSLFISRREIFDAFFMENMSIYAGFLFFGVLYTPISFILSILMQIFSRRNEYEADRFAVATTKDAESFINALKKLAVSNLSNLTPHKFYVFLHFSHPPLLERIAGVRRYL